MVQTLVPSKSEQSYCSCLSTSSGPQEHKPALSSDLPVVAWMLLPANPPRRGGQGRGLQCQVRGEAETRPGGPNSRAAPAGCPGGDAAAAAASASAGSSGPVCWAVRHPNKELSFFPEKGGGRWVPAGSHRAQDSARGAASPRGRAACAEPPGEAGGSAVRTPAHGLRHPGPVLFIHNKFNKALLNSSC